MTETFEVSQQTASAETRQLRFRAFVLIWIAQLVARIGNGLTAFGLSVYVYQQTGEATSVAMVVMSAFLPAIALAPVGGVLADRMDRRLLMILGDSLSALGLVALLAVFQTGCATVPLICICVAVSSLFSSVMDPAFRATVTDLLPPDQFTRAAGMMQFASASQYLISPAIAGLLLANFGINLVLQIDIATMAVTILSMIVVWRTVKTEQCGPRQGFWDDFRFGLAYLAGRGDIVVLMVLATFITFCMGFLQTLLAPMLLDLTDEATLGLIQSAAAVGMVVSALLIGIFSLGHRYCLAMSLGLAVGGIAIMSMGVTINVLAIGIFAFLFFMALPPLNSSVEVLVRSSIPNETQGRVWGFMGLVSQLGYIAAYAVSGVLADAVFNPLLVAEGALSEGLGQVLGVGPSRGIGLMFIFIGSLLVLLAVVLPAIRRLRVLSEYAKTAAVAVT